MKEKILVIEDDANVLEGIKDILTETGFLVASALNGYEGIRKAKDFQPDLIICDIMMHGADGFQVLTEIKENIVTKGTPFIFISAKAEIDDIRKGMMSGADDYIVKPFRLDDLIQSVQIRLARKNELVDSANRKLNQDDKKNRYDDKILITVRDESFFVHFNEIAWLTALSEYSQIELTNGKKYTIRKLLKEWEDVLPDSAFIRIHRSTIINIEAVEKIESWFKRSMKVKMKYSNQEFIVSQRYTSKIKSQLGF